MHSNNVRMIMLLKYHPRYHRCDLHYLDINPNNVVISILFTCHHTHNNVIYNIYTHTHICHEWETNKQRGRDRENTCWVSNSRRWHGQNQEDWEANFVKYALIFSLVQVKVQVIPINCMHILLLKDREICEEKNLVRSSPWP